MMQLIIGYDALDLYENTKITFKQTNPLFAFDKLECERSASFGIPATMKNNAIFFVSNDPATVGYQVRRKHDAQLVLNGIPMNGVLHITSTTRDEYRCVFVTGQLLGLQRIRNAGKVKDICTLHYTALYGNSYSPPSNYTALPLRAINYMREDTNFPPIPSLRIYDIVANCMQQLGVGITYPMYQTAWENYRLIPNEVNGLTERQVAFYRVGTANMSSSSTPNITTASFTGLSWLFNSQYATVAYRRDTGQQSMLYKGRLMQLVPRQEITLIFPSNFPNDIFVGKFINGGTQFASECQFYGDYSFDDYGNVTGSPLAGRSVTIPINEPFVFVSQSNDFYNGPESGGSTGWGWFRGGYPTQIDETMNMSGKAVVANPVCNVQLEDNLPDVTIVDLLKTIAALTGMVLNYSEADGVSFEDLSEAPTWPIIDTADKVLEGGEGDTTRAFSDYAQKNSVIFDSSEQVLESERIKQTYTINNENIEAERTLQTIPFDEGGAYDSMIFIRNKGGEYDKTSIANSSTRLSGMLRVSLLRNAGLANLCDASTSVTMRMRMPYSQYVQLKPKQVILYNCIMYVWTEVQWSNDVATFKLSKIKFQQQRSKSGSSKGTDESKEIGEKNNA